MLEQLIAPGDYIYGFHFPSATRGGNPGMCNVGAVDVLMYRQRTTTRHHGFLWHKKTTATSVIQVGFRWLPWVDGKINYCEHQGLDVLSGWFSGCWMACYTEGSARVCHIALQDNDHDCKEAWRAKTREVLVRAVREFRPHTSTKKGSVKLGLVTTSKALYAIGLDAVTIEITNPWKDPDTWQRHMPTLPRHFAEEFAQRATVPVGNIHPAGAWQIREIKGPLRPQTFPGT